MAPATIESPLFSLPTELLDRIFDYLADDHRDIASCRLVNSTFRNGSSPYLITKVIFAKRPLELIKIQEVACDPFFSRYVTHMVYDLSHWKFNEIDMNDITEHMEYFSACEEAEDLGIRDLDNDANVAPSQPKSGRLSELLRIHTISEETISALENLDDFTPSPKADTDPAVLPLAYTLYTPDGEDSEPSSILCHKSFPQYKRYARFHEIFTAQYEHLKVLHDVAHKFPRLRKITFTDYRGLARRGETYRDLCTRLFGDVLEPERWHWQLDNGLCTMDAMLALGAVALKGELQSVAFGPHHYQILALPQETLVTYKEPHYLSLEDISDGFPAADDCKDVFKNLRSFRLPLLFEGARFPLEKAARLLDGLPESIAKLALAAKGPIEGTELQEIMIEETVRPFNELVAKRHFPHLESLELEGWCIELETLKEFLTKHASTLRTLHLINLYLATQGENPGPSHILSFGDFVGRELQLDGVEIIEVKVLGPVESLGDRGDSLWLDPALQFELNEEWDGSMPVAALPDSRAEKRCLAGRPNKIHRRRLPTTKGQKGDDLGDIPAYW
ncbi:hypothetical protein WHR41_05212 [Cladosporium halotolerans]|uniref:F-box domain-containing protein n=1 Tax=Cladosporium halotolerans TaxID=1052096 RepID=A0AB34KN12_9PEZI